MSGPSRLPAERPNRPITEPIAPAVRDGLADADALTRKAAQVARGGARAGVLGVNDGLVSTLCLILGVAGADASASSVRLAGFAAMIAGALSMAAGEWISVRSQMDLFGGVLDELRRLLGRNPRLVLDRLVEKLREDGVAPDTARRLTSELPLDGPVFFRFASRTMFGVDPDDLGSPVTAAASSLVLFTIGALVPLTPWFIGEGTAAVVASAVATGAASLGVGAWIGWSAGGSPVRSGIRQLAIVAFAAAVTFGVGALFGTAVA
jgi:vacuolar iron transporter family protein